MIFYPIYIASSEEHKRLQHADELAKGTLAFVNQEVKECENMRRLEDLQKRMDKKAIENSTHPLLQNYKVSTRYNK